VFTPFHKPPYPYPYGRSVDETMTPANITRGANHLAEGDTADSLANRAKIRLSAEEWNIIKAAVEHDLAIPTDASQNVLLGYYYTQQKQSRQLEKERSEIRKRRDSTIAASATFRAERSNASYTNSKRYHIVRSRVENLEHSDR
jgi:hypothetical protein